METKHTPGPWAVYHDHPDADTAKSLAHIRALGAEPHLNEIASVYCCDIATEQTANARLIAAAPELLEALNSVLPYVNAGEALIVRAAIAKATGAQA